MPYTGKTYPIVCDRGGLDLSPNIDSLEATQIISIRNINLHEGGRGSRGGTSKDNGTAVSGSPQIMGLHNFITQSGNSFKVFYANDGKIYKNYTTSLKSGLDTSAFGSFEVFGDTLYFANGVDVAQIWNGSAGTTSDITNPAADWIAGNRPKQFITHGRGASRRMWALGFKDGSVYSSKLADGTDFSAGVVIKLVIETGDGYGIVGGIEWQENLICFGKRKAYIISDSDTDTSKWGYIKAAWDGGISHHRLVCRTPNNDVICMSDDGEVYSLQAVQAAGNYISASIARPSFIDRFIKNNTDLSQIDKFHMIYDPAIRAVRIYVVRKGKTTVDTCLVYFIDRPPKEAWSVHDNQSYASGHSSSCSALVKESDGYRVYNGDYAGFIWKTETSTKNDDSNPYYAGFMTPNFACDNIRASKQFDMGWLVNVPRGASSINVNIWLDGSQQIATSVNLSGLGSILDSFLLDTDVLGGVGLVNSPFEIGNTGKRIRYEVYNSAVNEPFFVSSILTDYLDLGFLP